MSESAVKYAVVTADTLLQSGFSKYYGYIVSAATATGVIQIRDGLTASGTVIDAIPASTAQGVKSHLANPIQCSQGLFIDFTGTGTLTIMYE